MSSDDWTIKPLGELITLQRGYDLPKSEFVFGEYPIAGSNGIIGYHNQFSTEGPSITIGRSGNLGTPYFYEGNFWAHNTTLFVKEFKNSDPKFMYYLFQILDFSTLNSGSAVPSLNRNYIHPIRVLVPKRIETQRRIAEILSALDEKIELNRQTNATLEALAQAIFKEWFVDFNYPGATGEMVESELGPIPKGWRVGKVNEVIKRIPSGKKFDFKSALREGKVPIIDQAHFRTIGFHNEEPGVIATPDQPVIVFSNHRCYTAIFQSSFSAIQNVLPFIGKNVDTYWLYHATNGIITYSEYKGHWPDFISISIIIPPFELTKEYGELVKDGHSIIVENNAENQTLIAIRDSLLPRLMKKEVEF